VSPASRFFPASRTSLVVSCNTAGCHRVAYRALECHRCHQDLQRWSKKPTDFLVHGVDFQRQHGKMARGASRAHNSRTAPSARWSVSLLTATKTRRTESQVGR